jgi:hypothetical protein
VAEITQAPGALPGSGGASGATGSSGVLLIVFAGLFLVAVGGGYGVWLRYSSRR